MNPLIATKQLAIIVSKIVKRVVSHIIFTSYAGNICLQHERKHVDVGATSPNARSMDSVIQTVHSFLMRRLVRRHVRSYCTFDDFRDNNCQSCLWLFNDSLECTCILHWRINLLPHISQRIALAHILGEVGWLNVLLQYRERLTSSCKWLTMPEITVAYLSTEWRGSCVVPDSDG